MDDCGAILHNIETKWLYDFLTLEKCRNFSQAAVSRNVSQPAFSRRIRALEQAIGVELFNRQVTPLQLSEQGKIFHSQIRHLLQQLESNLAAAWRQRLRATKNQDSRCTLSFPRAVTVHYQPDAAALYLGN